MTDFDWGWHISVSSGYESSFWSYISTACPRKTIEKSEYTTHDHYLPRSVHSPLGRKLLMSPSSAGRIRSSCRAQAPCQPSSVAADVLVGLNHRSVTAGWIWHSLHSLRAPASRFIRHWFMHLSFGYLPHVFEKCASLSSFPLVSLSIFLSFSRQPSFV